MAFSFGSAVTKLYSKAAKPLQKVTEQAIKEPVPKQPSVSEMGDEALNAATNAIKGAGISGGGGSSFAPGAKSKGGGRGVAG